ncbi:MAG: hypothetical protein J7M25_03125 [Deltaproteobacteria bacterium]|nr:hypothetical protein [Deltaproteobacteria bacterium]
MARKKLGQILVEAGLITQQQLRQAIDTQAQWGGPLGQVLVEMGFVDENKLVQALGYQLSIPIAPLGDIDIAQSVLNLVPAETCQRHGLIPFRLDPVGNFLHVAMVEPMVLDTLEDLRVITSCNIHPYFTTYSALARALLRYYGVQLQQDQRRATLPMDDAGFLSGATFATAAASAGAPIREMSPQTIETRAQAPTEKISRSLAHMETNPVLLELQRSMLTLTRQQVELQQNLADLSRTIQQIEAYLERDEGVLKSILKLVVEKGVCTAKELKTILGN